MSDRPTADDLLDIARDSVLLELLPLLPKSAHYTARMVANALAIARREQASPGVDADALATLVILAGGEPATPRAEWAGHLVARIRSGTFDEVPELRRQLVDALARWTRARVAISNPRILATPAA
ncbi:MAG: DUF6285 domain-containing protein [Casimicrobiaceae bacterium]